MHKCATTKDTKSSLNWQDSQLSKSKKKVFKKLELRYDSVRVAAADKIDLVTAMIRKLSPAVLSLLWQKNPPTEVFYNSQGCHN